MRRLSLLVIAMAAVSACAPAAPADGRTISSPAGDRPATKSLSIAIRGEPDFFILGIGGAAIAGVSAGGLQAAVHQGLATYDERGQILPQLAPELPSQTRGSWVVQADGRMQTTWRIHRNVTWHDGTPLTARDFVLGWSMSVDPELPVTKKVAPSQIAGIHTPDDWTLVVEWTKTYPFANALVGDDLPPVASHLVEATYRADKERLAQSLYWTREFVGVGPYQLAEWQPGSHLTLRAYESFFGGRPRIDSITARFIDNEPTIVANLLAGQVDGVLDGTLDFQQSRFVTEEWERAGRKPVVITQTTHRRMLSVQFRPEVASPREILDVRLRRALLHAIDREALIDAVLGGQSPVSETFVPPDDARWEWLRDVVIAHDYSQQRTHQLLGDIGWRRGGDGTFGNPSGERSIIQIRVGSAQEQEATIVADYWRAAGLNVEQIVLSPGQQRDQKYVSLFPAIHVASIPLAFEWDLQRLYGPLCPTEQSAWTGSNRGCYQNPDMDRIGDALRTAIDPDEQRRLWRQFVRIQSQELPLLPVYFNVRLTVFREGISGVKGSARPSGSGTWNVAEWDVA